MRYLLPFWLLLVLTGCKNKEDEPQFKTVYQLQLSGTARKTAKIKGSFAFQNPAEKDVWTFVSLMSDISMEGKDVGTYVFTDNVPIKSGSEFKVPLLYSMDNDKLPLKEDTSEQSVAIRLKGHVLLVSEKGDKLKVPFDHTETVKASIQRENKKDERQEHKEEKNLRKELRKQQKEQLKLEKSNQ
jgi:hypothetical protein